MKEPLRTFVAYAREDKALKEQLELRTASATCSVDGRSRSTCAAAGFYRLERG